MSWEERVAHWLQDGETRAMALRWGWWISLGVLALGYGVIAYTLFY